MATFSDKIRFIRWRRLVGILGGIVAVIIILVSMVALYLNTDTGQKQLVRWINNELAEADGGIKIGPIEGSVFSEFTLSTFVITDQDGDWLEIENAQINWSPLKLLSRRISISNLNVDNIIFHRLPHRSSQGQLEDANSFVLPTLPIDIEISSLNVAKLTTKETILGAPKTFQSTGTIRLTRSDGILIDTKLANSNKGNENISLRLVYPADGHDLKVDIQALSPEGGTLATLFALKDVGAISARLQGAGPIDNWSGTLLAQVGAAEIINATLQRRNSTIAVRAQLNAGELVSDTATSLFGRTASLAIDLNPGDEDQQHLSVDLIAETLRLNAEGTLASNDPMASDSIDFSIKVIEASPFNRTITPAYFEPFLLTGTIQSPLDNPSLEAAFQGLRTGFNASIGSRVDGRIQAIMRGSSINFNAKGRADDIQGDAVTDILPLVEPGFDWSIEGSFNSDKAEMALRNLSLTNALIMLEANVDLSTETGALTSEIALATEKFEINNKLATELIGDTPRLNTSIVRKTNGTLVVSDMVLEARHFTLESNAEITPEQRIDDGRYKLVLSDLKKVEGLGHLQLDGTISALGTISGDLASPSLTLETRLNELDIQNFKFRNFAVQINAGNIATSPSGAIKINAETNMGALKLAANISKTQATAYSIPNLELALGAYHADGTLSIKENGLATGSISIANKDNSQSETVEANIQLTADDGKQHIYAESKLADLSFPFGDNEIITIGSGALSSTILLDEQYPKIALKAVLSDVTHPRLQADQIDLDLNQEHGRIDYTAHLRGRDLMAYTLTLNGHSEALEKNLRKVILSIEGVIDEAPIHTVAPIEALIDGRDFTLRPFQLEYGDGMFGASMSSNKNHLIAALDVKNIDIKPITTFVPELPITGRLSGQFKLKATPDLVDGAFGFTLSNIEHGFQTIELDQALEISVKGQVNETNVSLSGRAQLGDLPNGRFFADLPVSFDFASNHILFPEDRNMKAEVAWQGDISPVWPILGLINHDLSGNLDTDLTIKGTYSDPDIDGKIRMTEGRYENLQVGFVATNIDLAATIKDRRLTVDQLTARDGANGEIAATANAELHPDLSFDARADLDLSSTHIIRKPRLDVTASSKLSFQKNAEGTNLVGDITVEQAHVGAITQGAPTIVELDVREINLEGEEISPPEAKGKHIGPVVLDLNFTAPGRLFIQSYGLDSEWDADLMISGTSDEPIVSGTASLIRGFFEFSGKQFQLSSGTLTFPGDRSNDPLIDITAEYQLIDLTAILRISGRASRPVLEVNSSPSLPQDEVLSRILFGTSVAELSAIEAVQLATAIHSLTNGGGPGLVGGVRRALGLDRFSVDSANGREYGTTITGGKYLSDNVYIEVTTAPTTGESATSIEVSLTPNLSLVTRRTLDQDNNLSIRWSWDY